MKNPKLKKHEYELSSSFIHKLKNINNTMGIYA